MYTDVNGHKTFYSNGNGQPDSSRSNLVFLHGAGMDHSVWTMPVRYFARHGLNVFAFDLPGHGRSGGAPLKSIDDMADWVVSAMDALNVTKASFVGHSMGSLIALSLAARHPDRVSQASFLGTSAPMPVGEPLLAAAEANDQDAFHMVNTWSHSSQVGGNENPGMSMLLSGQRLLERSGDDVLFTDLSACNEFTGGQEYLGRIKAPCQVILGKQDKMTAAASARNLAASLEDCRLVELTNCGHSMLSERPNDVLDALRDFID